MSLSIDKIKIILSNGFLVKTLDKYNEFDLLMNLLESDLNKKTLINYSSELNHLVNLINLKISDLTTQTNFKSVQRKINMEYNSGTINDINDTIMYYIKSKQCIEKLFK
jgi:hypothetical protein